MIDDPHLDADTREALATAQPVEREVRNGSGVTYLRTVKPVETESDIVDRVIATYIEIADKGAGGVADDTAVQDWRSGVVAQMGQMALATRNLSKFFDETCRLLKTAFDCDCTKILKLNGSETSFALIAGEGWKPGCVGSTETGTGRKSQAGYTLLEEHDVLVRDLSNDDRVNGPKLLLDHGVRSGISSLIEVGGKPWGIIGLHKCETGGFNEADLTTLKSISRIIAMAIMQATREDFLTRERIIQSLSMGVAEIGVWTQDLESGVLVWDARFRRITGLAEQNVVPVMSEFVSRIADEDKELFENSLADLLEDGEAQDIEVRFFPPGRKMVWLDVRAVRIEQDGKALAIGIVSDITERKQAEERSDFMMRELDHRVKNLLAIILSIAEITSRSTSDIELYKRDFRGRLESMARTHSLLAQADWSGLDLAELVEAEMLSFSGRKALQIEGPAISLAPGAAQALAMFLHELAANAKKHGSLSKEGGKVRVAWDVTVGEDGMLRLSWHESGGPEVVTRPEREGFGSKVINRIVKRQLDAAVETEWEGEGIELEASFPLSKILPRSATDTIVGPSTMGAIEHGLLKGKRILVVDDEWLIAEQHAKVFASIGAEVLGPYISLAEASLENPEGVDLAVLDFALSGEGDILPLAHRLASEGVPMLFVVGQDSQIDLPEALADTPILFKPATADLLIKSASKLVSASRTGTTQS
jgi:two-component system CheB/CheR fusion protein